MNKRWFWLAVALQLLFLAGMVGKHSFTLVTGQPVRLQVVPVDPWDFFRGEYVTLRYEMSRMQSDVTDIQLPADLRRNQTVYVTVRPDVNGMFHPVSVATTMQAPPKGHVVIKGRVEWYWQGHGDIPGELQVRYGIEQFYVPEGEGRRLEQNMERMTVEVVVDRFGRAALRHVFLDGEPINWR